MRAQIENWLLSYWYGTKRPPWLLRSLEPVYQTVFRYQKARAEKDSGQNQVNVPLIVVGNITAGGTGKTPLVIQLSKLARELDLKPGIASTCYGRESRETVSVTPESDPRLCGDEPVLLAHRTGMPVVVASRRLEAIKTLEALGVDIIISDDGLQQASLSADIEICVIDGSRGLGNGFQIPAGPLREPASRLNIVDFVVSNGPWAECPKDLEVHQMDLQCDSACALDADTTVSLETFRQKYAGTTVHAMAGIGNPDRFFSMLQTLGFTTQTHVFPDHHTFKEKDFEPFKNASAIIMTEKDAVKCRSLGLENAWYLPVNCQLSKEFETRMKDQLKRLTGDVT